MAQREQSEAGAGGWFSLHQSCLGPAGFLPGDGSQDTPCSFWECEGSFGIPTVFSFPQWHLAGAGDLIPFSAGASFPAAQQGGTLGQGWGDRGVSCIGVPEPTKPQDDPLEEAMATHCSILAWRRIPWSAEPSGLQSIGSQRVRHD